MMSRRNRGLFWLAAVVTLTGAMTASAQYPGQIVSAGDNAPTLRAVAVFEWTGDEAHPTASRLIPVCIYDGQSLEDAGVYLARPVPLAVESGVEYQLFTNGKPAGLFDVSRAGQQQKTWIGLGQWKPLPKPKPQAAETAKIDAFGDAASDEPVLHRKHHPGEANASGKSSESNAARNAPPPDPDRPTLRPPPDASQPGGSSSSADDSATESGSGRPRLQKKQEADEGYVTSVAKLSDPDRPHLFRGKPSGEGLQVAPTLLGFPAEMQQQVAVSDAIDRPVHAWSFFWADPSDEARMKAAMEQLARQALGLAASSAQPQAVTAPSVPMRLTLAPAPLLDEQFRVFKLAYGASATMVLSAHTEGAGANERFVTLVAQPDFYGSVTVLVKNVTDAAHLDDTPRMRLVDAVDALADSRGELLFELRGATQRQFALYRVLRGKATRLFVSGTVPLAAAW